MRVTRKDVAEKAGVSAATVSYVLNDSRKLTSATRLKVMNAVNELGYKPDMIARSMVTNETKQLSIIVNDIINPFYGEIVLGFENAAIEKGYFVNICTGFKDIDEYIENFLARRIDGVFITAIPYKFQFNKLYKLVEAGIRVVVSGNVEADMKKVSLVENNYIEGMEKAIKHLKGLGHHRIAFVSGLSKRHHYDTKIDTYLSLMKDNGYFETESLLVEGQEPYGTTDLEGYQLTKKLIKSKKEFTAIICTNDFMAFGCINALKEVGLNIPKDISVLSFDNIHLGSIWNPPLTTMSVPKNYLGEKAFELLYANIKKGTTGFYMNELELIVRNTTGPVSS